MPSHLQQAGYQPANDQQGQAADYTATASFNRGTGAFHNPEMFPNRDPSLYTPGASQERQLSYYVQPHFKDEPHDGRSLKAERAAEYKSRKQVEEWRRKAAERKEKKKRDYLKS